MNGVIVNLGRILSPEEMAQEIVEEVHRVLDSGLHGQSLFAKSMAHLLKERVWERPRVLRNASIPPMTFDAFLKESYPRGLGTTHDAVRRLIDASPDEADRAEATALWAKLTMKGAGNPRIEEQPRGADGRVQAKDRIFDNIQDTAKAPTGTSKDAGMRRLIPPGGVDDAQYCRTSDRTHEPTGAQSGRRRRQREAPRWGSRMRSRGCSWINPRF